LEVHGIERNGRKGQKLLHFWLPAQFKPIKPV